MGFFVLCWEELHICRLLYESHKYKLAGTIILINQSFFPADKDNKSQILIHMFAPSLTLFCDLKFVQIQNISQVVWLLKCQFGLT